MNFESLRAPLNHHIYPLPPLQGGSAGNGYRFNVRQPTLKWLAKSLWPCYLTSLVLSFPICKTEKIPPDSHLEGLGNGKVPGVVCAESTAHISVCKDLEQQTFKNCMYFKKLYVYFQKHLLGLSAWVSFLLEVSKNKSPRPPTTGHTIDISYFVFWDCHNFVPPSSTLSHTFKKLLCSKLRLHCSPHLVPHNSCLVFMYEPWWSLSLLPYTKISLRVIFKK